MTNITVYGTPISTYVRTVRLLLEEAGVDYRLQDVDFFKGETNTPEYRAKHPFGKVPVLEVDGAVIYETAAIVGYLDAVVAANKFTPSDSLLQARMRQIMGIIDSYLYSLAISTIVIQRLIVPRQGGQPDEEKIQNAIAPAKTAVEAIEAIAVGSPYLLGSEITIADLYLIPIFIYFSRTPEFQAVTVQTPKLLTWWNHASNLPSIKKVSS
ncbi:MAG: glutathione S-transferase family protein [Oscillatoriales cyanobacterium C42_A2020_001]|nr:glutathione S-transferase family protein [Leptolyngbyaceae cyanobacterium C42_A2020_001]